AQVAAPVRTNGAELFVTVEAPEGRREVALFEYAAGMPSRQADYSKERARGYGEAAGLIHTGMDTFRSSHSRFDIDLSNLLHDPRKEIEPRLRHRPDDWQYIRLLAEKVEKEVLAAHPDLTWGICHGDFHGGNASFREDGSVTVYDFDCAGFGWRAYDVAVFR